MPVLRDFSISVYLFKFLIMKVNPEWREPPGAPSAPPAPPPSRCRPGPARPGRRLQPGSRRGRPCLPSRPLGDKAPQHGAGRPQTTRGKPPCPGPPSAGGGSRSRGLTVGACAAAPPPPAGGRRCQDEAEEAEAQAGSSRLSPGPPGVAVPASTPRLEAEEAAAAPPPARRSHGPARPELLDGR